MGLDAFPLQPDENLKRRVKEHWEHDPCAIRYVDGEDGDFLATYARLDRHVYELDYMRAGFAAFEQARGKRVLEVGLGVGSDLLNWVRAGADVSGVDLTQASVSLIRKRLAAEHLNAEVIIGDAENLPFPDAHFDIYYSWGVLHHTPDTRKALAQAWRVLKPGGTLKLMLYHYPSVFAYLVWMLYGPFKGNFIGPRKVIFDNVESPGTKSFTEAEVKEMLSACDPAAATDASLKIRTYLASPDLLSFGLSEKYQGLKWRVIQQIYPRGLVKLLAGDRFGTFMTIEATKGHR
jgi:ubiquinone/menaquinone biosynthesis C-methylase UbiE